MSQLTNKKLKTFDGNEYFDMEQFNNENMNRIDALLVVDEVVGAFNLLPTPSATLLNKKYKTLDTNIVYKCKNVRGVYTWVEDGGGGSGSGFEIVDVDPVLSSRDDLGRAIYNRTEDKYKVSEIATPAAYNWEFLTYTSGTDASRPALGYYHATDTNKWYKDNVDITSDVTENSVEPSSETVGKLYFFDTLLHLGTGAAESYRFSVIKTGGIGTNDWHYEIELDNGLLSATTGKGVIDYLSDCKDFKPIKQYGGLADDAYGDWDKSGLWDLIDCVTKTQDEREPNQILHKHYLSKLQDGVTPADLTTVGNDVFARIKKFYIWIEGKSYEKLSTGVVIPRRPHIHIASKKLNDFYFASTHRIGDDNIAYEAAADYIGMYEAYSTGNSVYSSSGKAPTGNISVANWHQYIKNKNATRGQEMIDAKQHYNLVGMKERNILWILGLFLTKNKNLRGWCGEGRVKTNNTGTINTGTRNDLGFVSGNSNQTDGVRMIIENPWGNIHEFSTDGAWGSSTGNVDYKWYFTNNPDPARIDATFSNYEIVYNVKDKTGNLMANAQVFPKSYLMENNLCALTMPAELGASLSTYMCGDFYGLNDDNGNRAALSYGGYWPHAAYAALLYVNDYALSNATAYITARLCIK